MKTTRWILFLAVLLVATAGALAQTNAPVVDGATDDVLKSGRDYFQFLITPATLVLVYGIRKFFNKIPSEFVPFVVPFLGAGLSMLSAQLGVWQSNGIAIDAIAGAALGGLSTWVHQMGKQSGVIPETPSSDVVKKP